MDSAAFVPFVAHLREKPDAGVDASIEVGKVKLFIGRVDTIVW